MDPELPGPPKTARRDTARVLLLDDVGRLLLFEVHDSRVSDHPYWITPGGGIEMDEIPVVAARRELQEETGYVADADALVGPVAVSRGMAVFSDVPTYCEDWFYACTVADLVIDRTGWTDLEREVLRGARWWSAPELRAASDVIYPDPSSLAPLVQDLAAGRWDGALVELPWWLGPAVTP